MAGVVEASTKALDHVEKHVAGGTLYVPGYGRSWMAGGVGAFTKALGHVETHGATGTGTGTSLVPGGDGWPV